MFQAYGIKAAAKADNFRKVREVEKISFFLFTSQIWVVFG
jgi:hypothetical protein